MAGTSRRRERLASVSLLGLATVLLTLLASSGAIGLDEPGIRSAGSKEKAEGPLVVSSVNPRYFTVGSAKSNRVVYLTGAHIFPNLQDGVGIGPLCSRTEPFDYPAYLDYLTSHQLNYIRLWRWEHFQSSVQGGAFHFCASPQPWARTGPRTASDGKPRFNLTVFNQAYFDRLRDRVEAAGDRGIYVSIMLFNGFCLTDCDAPGNISGHPFADGNNVNGIAIQSITDYESSSVSSTVLELQRAYVRKVIDTVQDLPNVLFETSNESGHDSAPWQYSLINYVKQYEAAQHRVSKHNLQHPVGMGWYPGSTDLTLLTSPADWVSPGISPDVLADPPAADGTKLLIGDTDHQAAFEATPLSVWKSFVRGWNPIVEDGKLHDEPLWQPAFPDQEPAELALGDTHRYANMMNLVSMQPRGDLSSTGYALANPGREYLVLQPGSASNPFSVKLAPGTYNLSWYVLNDRSTAKGGRTRSDGSPNTFTAPAGTSGPVILYLSQA